VIKADFQESRPKKAVMGNPKKLVLSGRSKSEAPPGRGGTNGPPHVAKAISSGLLSLIMNQVRPALEKKVEGKRRNRGDKNITYFSKKSANRRKSYARSPSIFCKKDGIGEGPLFSSSKAESNCTIKPGVCHKGSHRRVKGKKGKREKRRVNEKGKGDVMENAVAGQVSRRPADLVRQTSFWGAQLGHSKKEGRSHVAQKNDRTGKGAQMERGLRGPWLTRTFALSHARVSRRHNEVRTGDANRISHRVGEGPSLDNARQKNDLVDHSSGAGGMLKNGMKGKEVLKGG